MNAHQLNLFDYSTPVSTSEVVVAPAKGAPVNNPQPLWAKALAIPVMVLAALAAGEEGRRPKFIPAGSLTGAAELVADAYGIGLCRTLNLDEDEDLGGATTLGEARSDSYEFAISSRGGMGGAE